jgi:hypothetical protein
MAKTVNETKYDFMPYWKKEEQCFLDAKIEGKDALTGKKASTTWPRDIPQAQSQYQGWLSKVKDPDTDEFYHRRDKDGNIIKGTFPKHIVRQIVRIRTTDDKEYLYSNGYLIGYDVNGDPVSQSCSNPETWVKTGFMYKREFDQNSNRLKTKIVGPNARGTVYEMPFNEKNLKALFDKRITSEDLKLLSQKRIGELTFSLKDERNNTVRQIKDATGILHKSMDLFMKGFDYLYNGDFISPQQKAEMRQQAIEMGLLPREAGGPEVQPATAPPKGTYS